MVKKEGEKANQKGYRPISFAQYLKTTLNTDETLSLKREQQEDVSVMRAGGGPD